MQLPAVQTRRRLPATVFALGWVSFFTDLGSEMIVPLLPVFLAGLGGSKLDLGLLQGASELVVSLLKLASGWLSDRVRRRKPWIVLGYSISSAVRPLLAVVQAPWQAMLVRSGDRVGKGLRSAPRDALLADAVAAPDRGAAYGLQRAMDHAGALCGALVAFALLSAGCVERTIFALAAVPGAMAVAVLLLLVREAPHGAADVPAAQPPGDRRALLPFLFVVALGAVGAGVDLFLLARASELGVPTAHLPLLWVLLHVVRAALAAPLGALSDRLGRRRVIAFGFAAQIAVLVMFGLCDDAAWMWPLFALHGLHAAFTEGAERGFVADLTGAGRRGVVFGTYHAVQGIAAFAAPIGLGALWDGASAAAAFGAAAGCSLLALVLLVTVVPSSRAR